MAIQKKARIEKVRLIIVSLFIVFILILAYFPQTIQKTDRMLGDFLLEKAPKKQAPDNIVIVDIDDESLEEIAAWPWSRQLVAGLLQNLVHVYKPEVVGLDIVFPEIRNVEDNFVLQKVIEDSKIQICFAVAFDLNPQNITKKLGTLVHGKPVLDEYSSLTTPAYGYISSNSSLASVSRCFGHITPFVDSDGIVRSLPSIIEWQSQTWLPLGLVMHPKNRGFLKKQLVIPYEVKPETWKTVSAKDILLQTAPIDFIKGSYVLIGSSALGLSDRVITPIHPLLPGVLVHAEILNSQIQQSFKTISVPLNSIAIGFTLFTLIISAWVFNRFSPLRVLMFVISMLILWSLFVYVAIYGQTYNSISLPYWILLPFFMLQITYEWFVVNRHNSRITKLFQGYVAESVVKQILNTQEDVIEPRSILISILFADVEGFTKLAKELPIQDLSRITREVLTLLSDQIYQHHGTLDKYIGDAVMAFWNAPLEQVHHQDMALQCALSMLEKIEEYNKSHCDQPKIRIRIGIHNGYAMVGELGTEKRRTYTAIGDVVNKAHRLHEWSKDFDTDCLISEELYLNLSQPINSQKYRVYGELTTIDNFDQGR